MKIQIGSNPEIKGFGGSFNTLGFSGTTQKDETTGELHLEGKGVDLGNLTTLERRAKRKLITKTMNMLLRDIAAEEEEWKWHARFVAAIECQDKVTEANHRSHSYYCKQRCCLICLANRKAQIINTYLPVVEDMADPHFVTLTVVSVKKDELKQRVKDVAKAIRTLIARYKKRHQRGRGMKFYGMWSLESNFNPIARTYNPHIHLILPSEYAAETFWSDWVAYWKERNVKVDDKGQHYRRVKKDRTKDLIEIVKYGSKIFTEPDVAERMMYNTPRKPSFLYVRALYNILMAMDRLDVFNTFGFEPPKRKKRKYTTKVTEYTEWDYDLAAPDWINADMKLVNYTPPDELEALLTSRVNVDLE